ncbi:hypothetical protein [Paractinoplanes globisporus]|uniref:Lipoprotein n=1 Tax=Paractinoplanes globisporus TaxID=113565 RepID=A0ABW6WQ22_9ACTN|nr:hypothetical protein [Actinoplanes globisporus]
MNWVNVGIRVAAGSAAAALALGGTAGCGGSDSPADAAGPSASSGMGGPTTAPADTATKPPASPTPVLADGRSPVYLTGLNAKGNTVTFDLIEFLTGDAAKAEWQKEHPEQPDGPDDDYLIVNNNKKLRTLPVAAGAKCVVLATLGGTDTKTIAFADLPAFLKKQNKDLTVPKGEIAVLPFWLTVKGGAVTKLEEQFLP